MTHARSGFIPMDDVPGGPGGIPPYPFGGGPPYPCPVGGPYPGGIFPWGAAPPYATCGAPSNSLHQCLYHHCAASTHMDWESDLVVRVSDLVDHTLA